MNKYFLQVLLVGAITCLNSNARAKVHPENCQPESKSGPFLYNEDFKWGYSLPQLIQRFAEIYNSNKRLKNRAYLDERKVIRLPFYEQRGGSVEVDPKFVENIGQHILSAYRHKAIDGVFFPDMGHSHFFIPTGKYNEVYAPLPTERQSETYQRFFLDPDLKILYHTAEQLKTRDEDGIVFPDVRIQYRFKTRNLLGSNDGATDVEFLQNPQHAANTVGELPEYRYWGSGFNISANKNGCFSVLINGEPFKFDLSLYDLEMEFEYSGFQKRSKR